MTPAGLVEGLDDLLRSELAALEMELAAVASALRLDDARVAQFALAHHLHRAVAALLDSRPHAEALVELRTDRLTRLVPSWSDLLARAVAVDEVVAAALGERACVWRLEPW